VIKKKTQNKYHQRISRMITRWAGVKGPSRKNKNPAEKVGTKNSFP